MENNIKRIFVKNNNSDDRKYIVVLRENDFVMYKTEEKLNEVYLALVKEINDKLYDGKMNLRTLRDSLISMNIISYVNEDFISKIEKDEKSIRVYTDFEEEAKVISNDDSEALQEDYNAIKKALLEQYELKIPKDMPEKDKIVKFFGIKESDLENLKVIKEDKQKKVSNLSIRNLALLVAISLGLGGIGGYVISNMNKKEKSNNDNPKQSYSIPYLPTPNTTPYNHNVEIVDELPLLTEMPTNTPIVTQTPTMVPTATPEVTPLIKFSDMDLNLNGQEIVIDITPELLTFHYLEDLNYDDSTETLTTLSLEQMSEIGSILQNSNNKKDSYFGSLIFFENKFFNSEDISYVKYFSDLRNEVIYQSYYERNFEMAEKYVAAGNYEVVRCLLDNEPLPLKINGETRLVTYDDLSDEAKEVVFNLAYALQISLAHQDFMYNGKVYNQDAVHDVLDSVYNKNDSFSK